MRRRGKHEEGWDEKPINIGIIAVSAANAVFWPASNTLIQPYLSAGGDQGCEYIVAIGHRNRDRQPENLSATLAVGMCMRMTVAATL